MVGVWASSFDWHVSRKEQCANLIGFRIEKKLDSAQLNENFTATAFIFYMNNFCCGSKYTETKINLKRLHAAGGKGTTLEKPINESSPPNKLAGPEQRGCVYKLENNLKWMKKLKPGKWPNGKFFVRTYIYLHELAAISSELQGCVLNKLNILDAEQGI